MKPLFPILALAAAFAATALHARQIELKIDRNYLNIPVSHERGRVPLALSFDGQAETPVVVRLADAKVDYWVFRDVSAHRGKRLKIAVEGAGAGLEKIYLSDEIAGADSMYRERNRPQFHFTTRRGWINDPNGLLFHDGEYHLFYQHNPYERDWENMHWGHAVSADLVHWRELDDALRPDSLGTAFSGSAVIDHANTSGFGKAGKAPLVAFYTSALPGHQRQSVAFSLDGGRTFAKYAGNPVIDSRDKWRSGDTRDPKVFWYVPGGWWVMVLNERDGHSIYTSANLREWRYESHTTGLWECPELFELPVDGDPSRTLWVMYGASGTYMLGEFDGRKFTPTAGKYLYTRGSAYAAQTFTGMPDGRRVQIGWGRVSHPGMPFNGMMLLPTELTLRTTRDGVRLFSRPIAELDALFTPMAAARDLSADEAGRLVAEHWRGEGLRLKATISLSHATSAGIDLNGQRILDYDLNGNTVNGVFYSPEPMTSMDISADIYVDRTSVEVFIDGGAYSYSMERRAEGGDGRGFTFWGNSITIKELGISSVGSIW